MQFSSLGMKHDGSEAGNDCDSASYLMSPTLGSGKTQWSPCSQQYLDAFLKYSFLKSIIKNNCINCI